MTEEIILTVAEREWPEWATHVVIASYDPEGRELSTVYNSGAHVTRRRVKDDEVLPAGSYHLGSGVWLIPVDLEGEAADSDGDYHLELVGGPQYVQESDVVPIIRNPPPNPTPQNTPRNTSDEEIMQTIVEREWPEWATHVVIARYDPDTEQLKTLCMSGETYSLRLVRSGITLPPNLYDPASKVILIPVDLDGESPDGEGDYYLALEGGGRQYVQSSDVVPIIRGSAPAEGVPVDVLTSVLLGLRKDDENITEAELLKVFQFAKDFERFFKKPQ